MCGQEFGIEWDYICLLGPVKKKKKKKIKGNGRKISENITFCIGTVKKKKKQEHKKGVENLF